MSAQDSDTDAPKANAPVDPELGFLARSREWCDLLPWLRLSRIMRIAGSPLLVGMTWVTIGIWLLGTHWILQDDFPTRRGSLIEQNAVQAGVQSLSLISRLAYQTLPMSISHSDNRLANWEWWAASAWTLLVWSLPALVLLRQGAMLTAGRGMGPISTVLRLAKSRLIPAKLSILITLAGPALLVISLGLLVALIDQIPVVSTGNWILAAFAGLLLILAGILNFGSYFVAPLSWAAMVIEPVGDPIDAVSRGYESFLRRPLRLISYLIFAGLLLVILFVLEVGIVGSAISLGEIAIRWGSPADPSLITKVTLLLSFLPSAGLIAMIWGLVGGIYLLLRHDTGEQEIEDIWMPPETTIITLPTLPGQKS